MRYGLSLPNGGVCGDARVLAELGTLAEEAGWDGVFVEDYIVHQSDGAVPTCDPWIALAAMAVGTKRVRLGTGVNILSQTNPLMLAKQAASLDFVSNGRFMLGVGIGWLREEFDAMGTPFERRGARFDDYVVAMRKAWSGDVVEHESEFLRWKGFKSHPLPVQRPGVPIVIGGTKGKVFERIAQHGDGWFAPAASPAQLEPMLKQLAPACAKFGRDPKTSVLDPYCRAHDVANLFVVDASFFPSSAAVNPGLTIAAQALRVADHIMASD